MNLNDDFSLSALVHADQVAWQDSPMSGVQRRPLDRVGDEVARATTVVRYSPGSRFAPHVHTGGEEFLVLDGVFQDEHGDYPKGSYIRNPPGTRHTPGAEQGCTILVKLWQFDPLDDVSVALSAETIAANMKPRGEGVHCALLHEDGNETVSLFALQPHRTVDLSARQGLELFVVNGSCQFGDETLATHSWLREPGDGSLCLTSGDDGVRFWLKQHHLHKAHDQVERVLKHREMV